MAEKSTETPRSRGSQSPQSHAASAAAAQQSSSSPSGQAAQGTGTSSEAAHEQQAGRGSGALRRRSTLPSRATFGMSPFSFMRRMIEDMDRMFEDFGGLGRGVGFARELGAGVPATRASGGVERGGLGAVWAPAVEMFERDGQLVVRAELPGLSREDVRIEVTDDGSLLIQGERRSEFEAQEEGGLYRSERVYGRFSRVIALPDDVDVDKAQARFDNGVLEISFVLPDQSQRRRRIEIEGQGKSPSGTGEQAPDRTGQVH
jgi:HSP20 family protein